MFSVKWALVLHIVDVHKVDAAGVGTLFEYAAFEHFFCTHDLGTQVFSLFVFTVELFKTFCVGIKCLVQVRHLIGIKEGYVFFVFKSSPKECTQHNSVVHVPNTGLFSTLIVFKHNKIIKLKMPNRIKYRCTCIANTSL